MKVGMLLKGAFSALIVFFSLFVQSGLSHGKGIIILNSGQYNAYREVENGLKEAISTDPLATKLGLYHTKNYNLQSWKNKKALLLKDIESITPDLIFTIGTPATTFATENLHNVPIVYSMVTSWWRFKGRDVTGVHLKISEERLARLFSMLLEIDSIALLCGKDWRLHKGIYSLAQRTGVHVYLFRIDAKHTVYDALKIIKERGIKGLLMVPDTDVYDSPETIRFVLEWTKKNGIYVMGLSPGYLKMGADVTIEIPFKAIGHQTWALGRQILMGSDIRDILPQPPKEIHLLINKKTVEKNELKVPKEVLGIPVFIKP